MYKLLKYGITIYFLLLLFVWSFNALANFSPTDFAQDLKKADSMRTHVISSQLDPQKTFKHFQSNPNETHYFGGVAQSSDNGLNSDANTQSLIKPSGQAITHSFQTRPVFKLDPKSQLMKRGFLIKQDAHDIASGISDKYVDCTAHKICHETYVHKTCEESTRGVEEICTKTPHVTIKADKTVTLKGQIKQSPNHQTGTIDVQAMGAITSLQIYIKIPNDWGYRMPYRAYLNNVLLFSGRMIFHGDFWFWGYEEVSFKADHLTIPIYPNEPLNFKLVLQNGYNPTWQPATYVMTVLEKTPHITWQESCKDV